MDYAMEEALPSRLALITFVDHGKLRALPVPLARIHQCGMIEIEVLKEVVSTVACKQVIRC